MLRGGQIASLGRHTGGAGALGLSMLTFGSSQHGGGQFTLL